MTEDHLDWGSVSSAVDGLLFDSHNADESDKENVDEYFGDDFFFFFKLGFTPCKAEQPLRGTELQEKKHKKDYRIQKICLERIYS